jgi:transposase InsO family protein
MAWKTMDIQDQRVRFVVAASSGERGVSALCAEFGISRPTGYLWIERYRLGGVAAIAERSRRPHGSPRQTAWEVESQVVQLRMRYPDWGARKLAVLLGRQGIALPPTTVHRILLRHDLVHAVDRHSQARQRFERERCNELWQMDFKGPKGWQHPVGPLSVIDDHTRYLIVLHATGSARAELVREQLEQAFEACGVPEGMLMDHGTPWWSTQAPSGNTSLALWMMRQGIGLHWSRIRHPQTQGKVERFHGSLQRALDKRGTPRQNPQAWLDAYRWEHNHIRPHEALGMQTPASMWQPSPRRYDPQPPLWEYPEGAWVLKVDCQGKIETGGRKWKISRALAGDWVHLLPVEERILVFYCATLVRELDPAIRRSTIVERLIAEKQEPNNV